jgi:hypothetical protein
LPQKTKGIHERMEEWVVPEPNSGCWLWMGKTYWGYGLVAKTEGGRKVKRFAHRLSYEAAKGPIPDGLVIDHLCRTKCCVNPDHLEPVTARENVMRYHKARTHCPNGHKYEGLGNGKERCLTCKRASRRRHKAKS